MKKALLLAAVAAGSLAFGLKAHANSDIYRLYNANTGEHFYTASAGEKNADVNAGWNYEGTGWVAPSKGTAVYRVFNPNTKGAGSHYYTASKGEAAALVKLGWHWDNGAKAVFYSGGNIAVKVAYNANNGAHNYTTSSFEQNSLLNAGWKFGATAFKAVANGKTIAPGMNLGEISKGNLSSIAGVWKNPATGQTWQFSNSKVLLGGSQWVGLTDFSFYNGALEAIPNIQGIGGGFTFVPRGVTSIGGGWSGANLGDSSKDRLMYLDAGVPSPSLWYYKVN